MGFLQDSSRTILVRLLLIIVTLVTSIIQARFLGPQGMGVYVLLIMVGELAFQFGNLGFGSAFSYFSANKSISPKIIYQLIWLLSISLSLLSGILLLSIRNYNFSPWQDIASSLFFIALIPVPLVFINNFLRRMVAGQLNIKAFNIAEAIQGLGILVFSIIFIVALNLEVMGAMLAYITSNIISTLYIISEIRIDHGPRSTIQTETGKDKIITKLFSYGKWSYLNLLVNGLIEKLPLIFLKYFFSNQAVGVLSVARKLSNQVTNLVISPISLVLFPYVAASEAKDAVRRTNILCRNGILILGIVVLIFMASAHILIPLLYGEAFSKAVLLCYLIAPSIIFIPINHFPGIHVAASGDPKSVALRGVLVLLISLVLWSFFISRWGAVGAAISLSLSYILSALINLTIYLKQNNVKWSETILPRQADIIHYRNGFKMIQSHLGLLKLIK